jgi:hypothetical protein
MGGKTTTSTNKVTIPKEVLDRYNAINAQAAQVAQNPFQQYGTKPEEFVAQFNEQQLKGVEGINTVAGMGPVYENVDKYLNPYIKNVADTTRAQIEQANEQAQSGALGTAIQSNAFGGDRAGVAAANLAGQQNLALGSTMANIYNQGYTQAVDTSMNDRNRMLGVAGAQLGAGTQMQQTTQAGIDALINQFQQEQGYPFQVAQFLANIAMGFGALSGSTTTGTQMAPFFSDRRLKHDIKKIGEADNGLPIYTFKYKGDEHHQTHVGFMADEVEKKNPEAVGLDPSGYKTVDYNKATESMGGAVKAFADGGVAGPYGSKVGQGVGVGSYVPQAYLPVGELMVADPNAIAQSQSNFLDTLNSAATAGESVLKFRDHIKKITAEKARGGAINGYAVGGGVQPQVHSDYMSSTLAAQAANKDKPELKTAAPTEPPKPGIENVANILGSVATIASLSDRRAKHDIKRIGKTEKGLPIYTFKYKGDDREQTHVGFMADEVERDHPEAVGKRDGYKTVDYSQAHKFAAGGVAGRHGYALDGAVEERLRDAMRATAAAENGMRLTRDEVPAVQTLNNLPDAKVVAAEAPAGVAPAAVAAEAPTGVVPEAEENRTIAERLSDLRLSERIPAGMASMANLATVPFVGAAGVGLGLAGYPETGNAVMDFAKQRLVDTNDFADVSLGTDAQAQEIYRRRAAENFAAENAAANQAIAEAPLTVEQRPRPRPVEGGVAAGVPTDAYKQMASTMREAGISNLAGDKLVPTGVAPVEGQMRPKPRPEGLGAANVAAPVAPVKPTVDTGRKIASVIGSGNGFTDVVYTDGTKDRITGNLNFRNNNPGNLEYGDLAKKYGAVGTDGRFAVFPDYETGRKAQEALLFSSGVYEGKTIGSAIAKYAPLGDGSNDPVAYANNVAAALGIPVDTPLSALNPEQRSAMLTAMEKQEGGSGLSTFSTTPLGADGRPVPLQGGVAGGSGQGTVFGSGGEGRRGGVKPYDERNTLGKMVYDEDGKVNKNAMLSLFAGLGDMLTSPSPFLLPSIGAGVAGAARTYMAREEQVADIAKTNIENLNKLYDLYNSFIAQNEEYAGMTLEEFAKKNNLGHLLPKGSQLPTGTDVSPTSNDKMTVQEYRSGFVDMGGRKVAMSNDPASIQKFINDNAGFSPETYIGRQVEEARAQLLRLDQSGFTIDAETGEPFAMPGPISAKDVVARAEADRIASGEFRDQAPEAITAANRQTLLSNELAKVFVRAESGTLADPSAQLEGLLKAIDPQNTFGWADNFEVGKEDYDSAAKLAGEIIASRLQSLPGGAPASTIDLVSTVVPNLGIQPEAAKKLIAMQLAEARYTAELYRGYDPDPDVHGTDINAYGKQFASGDRFKKYYEEALESLPLFAGEVPPGIDPTVWSLMNKTEKKEAQNSYNLERGGLNGN